MQSQLWSSFENCQSDDNLNNRNKDFLTNFFTFPNNYQIHLYDMLYGVEIYWLVKLLLLTKTDEPAI